MLSDVLEAATASQCRELLRSAQAEEAQLLADCHAAPRFQNPFGPVAITADGTVLDASLVALSDPYGGLMQEPHAACSQSLGAAAAYLLESAALFRQADAVDLKAAQSLLSAQTVEEREEERRSSRSDDAAATVGELHEAARWLQLLEQDELQQSRRREMGLQELRVDSPTMPQLPDLSPVTALCGQLDAAVSAARRNGEMERVVRAAAPPEDDSFASAPVPAALVDEQAELTEWPELLLSQLRLRIPAVPPPAVSEADLPALPALPSVAEQLQAASDSPLSGAALPAYSASLPVSASEQQRDADFVFPSSLDGAALSPLSLLLSRMLQRAGAPQSAADITQPLSWAGDEQRHWAMDEPSLPALSNGSKRSSRLSELQCVPLQADWMPTVGGVESGGRAAADAAGVDSASFSGPPRARSSASMQK